MSSDNLPPSLAHISSHISSVLPSLQHLLQSNDVPSESETFYISKELLPHAVAALQSLETSEPERYSELRAQLTAAINVYKTILSPIRRVPRELIRELLSYARPQQTKIFDPAKTFGRLALGRVCSLWHAIYIGTPVWWTNLLIGMTSPHIQPKHCEWLWTRALALSGNLPLHLDFRFVVIDHPSRNLLPTMLSSCSERVKSFKLQTRGLAEEVELQILDVIDQGGYPLPILESIDLDFQSKALKPLPYEGMEMFSVAPKLHTVRFKSLNRITNLLKLPWTQLRTCIMDSIISERDILSLCPNLETLTVRYAGTAILTDDLMHNALRELKIDAALAHPRLILPSLERLSVKMDPHMIWLESIIGRTRALKSLDYHHDDLSEPVRFLPILHRITTIETLVLNINRNVDLGGMLLETLALPENEDLSPSRLLPNLREFDLKLGIAIHDDPTSQEISWETIINLLELRWTPDAQNRAPPRCLTKLAIKFDKPFNLPSDEQLCLLRTFKAQGLDLAFQHLYRSELNLSTPEPLLVELPWEDDSSFL